MAVIEQFQNCISKIYYLYEAQSTVRTLYACEMRTIFRFIAHQSLGWDIRNKSFMWCSEASAVLIGFIVISSNAFTGQRQIVITTQPDHMANTFWRSSPFRVAIVLHLTWTANTNMDAIVRQFDRPWSTQLQNRLRKFKANTRLRPITKDLFLFALVVVSVYCSGIVCEYRDHV